MRGIRALIGLGVCVSALWVMGGCAGVANTQEEAWNVAKQSLDNDLRQMGDDWNVLWLADRQYRLSKYQIR